MRGRFITFEGIDGAGKSTQHAWLAAHLRSLGHEVVATREPGGTPLGEQLRGLLLAEPMHIETEALLMFAARREHIAQVIEPALTRGAWVACDRFADASFAYQSGGRGLAWEKIAALRDWTLGHLQPDITFIFDIPVATAQERLAKINNQRDRFEQEQTAFFERVRAAYHRIATENPQRVTLIDATQSTEEINKLLEKSIARY
ncbi:thymidylate kinase [Rugosibacter aromaticivorans]|uniref:Thymidylate kinase n=1 Tax=Rugosibacter aromaticivorans TaxID=1565605 RepID=A0A0C5J8Q7_9PROT|nr:dTMP kinase [Rugosibacter aromaticivorans]AJP48355.1 thymidylate kinase [Rugosibacter aromaticivorans]TBR13778.1 MAG: dTMP kinase [Rugosibacter sp.]